MKNLKFAFLGVASILMVFAIVSMTPKSPDEEIKSPVIKKMTFADLQAKYGTDIYNEDGKMVSLDKSEEIQFFASANMNPTNCDVDLDPCGKAVGMARGQLQQLANECCCPIRSGVVCCDGSGFAIAITFLVTPGNGCSN